MNYKYDLFFQHIVLIVYKIIIKKEPAFTQVLICKIFYYFKTPTSVSPKSFAPIGPSLVIISSCLTTWSVR